MTLQPEYTCRSLGENVLLLEWPARITPGVLQVILDLQETIVAAAIPGLLESYHTYHTLALIYDPQTLSHYELEQKILAVSVSSGTVKKIRWYIPVYYNGEELEQLATQKGLKSEELIKIHSETTYLLYFYGFLPGFMYLGGLDERLHAQRKPTPVQAVPAGSLAIGGAQTGIYPTQSPGGWHIIGQSPLRFFIPHTEPPCFASPGDEIVFEPVDALAFREIAGEVEAGTYQLKKDQSDG